MLMVDRIIDLAKKKGISIAALEKAIGLSNGIIGKWKKQSPSCDKLKLVADYLNTTLDYLVYGKKISSPVTELSTDEQELLTYYNKLQDINKGKVIGTAKTLAELEVPVADETTNEIEPEESRLKINCSTYQVSAGAGFELGEGDEWYEIEVPDTPEARKADFALQIKGNSMEPIYFDGDIVLVKEQPSVDLGQIGIFNIEGSGYIKKFGGDRLISLNAEYDDIVFSDYDEDRIQCFGKVIGRV